MSPTLVTRETGIPWGCVRNSYTLRHSASAFFSKSFKFAIIKKPDRFLTFWPILEYFSLPERRRMKLQFSFLITSWTLYAIEIHVPKKNVFMCYVNDYYATSYTVYLQFFISFAFFISTQNMEWKFEFLFKIPAILIYEFREIPLLIKQIEQFKVLL